MARKKRTVEETQPTQLADLTRIPGLVIEGGRRTLGVWVRDGQDAYQPLVVLWLDSDSGMILNTQLIDPRQTADGGIGETVAALVGTLTGLPAGGGLPGAGGRGAARRTQGSPGGLPERVRVEDEALAAALREVLGPLDVAVEVVAELEAFEEAFAAMAESVGANPDAEPPAPFSWEVDAALLPPLFKAAAAYERLAPWNYMPDHPPLAIALGEDGPEPGVETLYASILGAAGEVFGAAFYYNPEGLRTHMREGEALMADDPRIDAMLDELRRTGAPVDEVPPEMLRTMVGGLLRQADSGGDGAGLPEPQDMDAMQEAQVDALLFSFDPQDEVDPTYLQWLEERGVRLGKRKQVASFFRSREGQEPRDLTDGEVRAITLAIEAVNAFFTQHGNLLSSGLISVEPLTVEARVGSGREQRTVTVTFPAPGFDFDEEDDLEPATPEQAATLYRFQVKLDWLKTTWRRIEMRGDQTLDDLHYAIQDAFGWDNDHLYAFFLSGKAWDSRTEYASPMSDSAEQYANDVRLAWLPLKPRQQFLYIFDFGDELRHQIKVEAITPNGVQEGVEYPRITERQGENEPQYPNLEDFEE